MARPIVEEGDGAPSFRPLWMLLPYLWPKGQPELRLRVIGSVVFLLAATAATSYSPLYYGYAIDKLAKTPAEIAMGAVMALIGAYIVSRIMMQALAQLRDGIFAKVQYHAMREVAVSTFAHVHTLSLRFHLERKTGGLSRVIERGTKGIDTMLSFALFSIFPTILLIGFYSVILWEKNGMWVTLVTLAMVVAYVWFTFAITRWRIQFRRDMNQSDQDANTKAVDSLLNYETVKYFNNEGHETRRFGVSMEKFSRASIQAQISLSVLNAGQAFIMAVGLGCVMALAALDIKAGRISVGTLVAANAILIQLYQPLNLLGLRPVRRRVHPDLAYRPRRPPQGGAGPDREGLRFKMKDSSSGKWGTAPDFSRKNRELSLIFRLSPFSALSEFELCKGVKRWKSGS